MSIINSFSIVKDVELSPYRATSRTTANERLKLKHATKNWIYVASKVQSKVRQRPTLLHLRMLLTRVQCYLFLALCTGLSRGKDRFYCSLDKRQRYYFISLCLWSQMSEIQVKGLMIVSSKMSESDKGLVKYV